MTDLVFYAVLGYASIGLAVAVPFLVVGVGRVVPAHSSAPRAASRR